MDSNVYKNICLWLSSANYSECFHKTTTTTLNLLFNIIPSTTHRKQNKENRKPFALVPLCGSTLTQFVSKETSMYIHHKHNEIHTHKRRKKMKKKTTFSNSSIRNKHHPRPSLTLYPLTIHRDHHNQCFIELTLYTHTRTNTKNTQHHRPHWNRKIYRHILVYTKCVIIYLFRIKMT